MGAWDMSRRRPPPCWTFAVLSLCLAACAAPARVQHPLSTTPVQVLDRTTAIERYLAGRELTPIEGIWVWDNNQYEVAIVRNTLGTATEYQYLGLVTDSQQSNWRR